MAFIGHGELLEVVSVGGPRFDLSLVDAAVSWLHQRRRFRSRMLGEFESVVRSGVEFAVGRHVLRWAPRPPVDRSWPAIVSCNRQKALRKGNRHHILTYSHEYVKKGVSPWPSCLMRWLGSLVHDRARDPSSRPSHGTHWHGSTQSTT